jgi:hypothetical protein
MSSPVWEGTYSSAPFTSRDIDIVKERIYVTLDKDFKTALFRIEYRIKADSSGKQIPLLFHAEGYAGDFKVWLDQTPVILMNIPEKVSGFKESPFNRFTHITQPPPAIGNREPETVKIYWEKNLGLYSRVTNLKYFETDISKGEHTIIVEYTANVWVDISRWVKEYSVRYSLSPAKHWRSFGELEITIDASRCGRKITTTLGSPQRGSVDSVATWVFSKLPDDFFTITYIPEVSLFAKALIFINPFWQILLVGIFLTWLHFQAIKKYRKKSKAKFSWVVITGSIIVPILVLFSYLFSFELIDAVIGPEAGRWHGYTFMILVLYPFLMPVYWVYMWWVDRNEKKKVSI